MSAFARRDADDPAFDVAADDELTLAELTASATPAAIPDAEALEISCRDLWVTIVDQTES